MILDAVELVRFLDLLHQIMLRVVHFGQSRPSAV